MKHVFRAQVAEVRCLSNWKTFGINNLSSRLRWLHFEIIIQMVAADAVACKQGEESARRESCVTGSPAHAAVMDNRRLVYETGA